jgi:hypothetical protein
MFWKMVFWRKHCQIFHQMLVSFSRGLSPRGKQQI